MCWAFAASSSIETNYIKRNNLHSVYDNDASNDPIRLSPAQLSYNATYKYSDGTINLSAKAPDSFTIKSGESIELATQTMDAGATVVITYNN